jgi:DNA-binding PucR family transcriptional regulator
VKAAIGAVGTGLAGFRATHHQALRAHQVALIGAERAQRITSFTAPGVRAAAALAGDLALARDLVTSMLGGLAQDDEGVARLRETLTVFLQQNQSFVATAAKVHLHKNTVKYRVDKAVRLRGRPIEEDRLDLELALAACRWLGPAVLTRSP